MQLTSSKSSKITKKGSWKKSSVSAPVLPSDIEFIKTLEDEKQARNKSSQLKKVDRLQNLGLTDLHLSQKPSSIVEGVRYILTHMFDEVPESGLGPDLYAEVHQWRKALPPLVMVSHIHSLYITEGTYLDREIKLACKRGLLRRLVVNQVDNAEMLIEARHYKSALDMAASSGSGKNGKSISTTLNKFWKLLGETPEATSLTDYDLEYGDLQQDRALLHNLGFLTLNTGADSGSYNLSLPNIGAYVRLVVMSRKWVCKLLEKSPWNEQLETQMRNRYTNTKSYWRVFKGCSLHWALRDCFASGWCEPFNTPTGRGWKLTGK